MILISGKFNPHIRITEISSISLRSRDTVGWLIQFLICKPEARIFNGHSQNEFRTFRCSCCVFLMRKNSSESVFQAPKAMAMLDTGITKLYYTISEVANLMEEEAHVLRYWESEFDVLRPRKNRAGKRVYTKDDIDVVYRIRHLLRDEKFTIDGARQILKKEKKASKEGSSSVEELKEIKLFFEKMLDRVKVD